jgi:hypothetical protein
MNNLERIKTVQLIAKSIEESLKEYEQAETKIAGYDIDKCDSKGSIQNRCLVARNELLEIMKGL